MNTRILAASMLAFGLMSPVAFADDTYNCSQDQQRRGEYIDCNSTRYTPRVSEYGAAVVQQTRSGPVGDFIDETPAESRQRSSH